MRRPSQYVPALMLTAFIAATIGSIVGCFFVSAWMLLSVFAFGLLSLEVGAYLFIVKYAQSELRRAVGVKK
jgi:hypothetical protein